MSYSAARCLPSSLVFLLSLLFLLLEKKDEAFPVEDCLDLSAEDMLIAGKNRETAAFGARQDEWMCAANTHARARSQTSGRGALALALALAVNWDWSRAARLVEREGLASK